MKRITFITTKLNLVDGGGSNYCLDFKARFFLKNKWNVKVITLNPNGNKLNEEPPYELIRESSPITNYLFASKNIVDIFKKYESVTDIFHVDGHVYFLEAAFYRKNSKVPVVLYFNNYMNSLNANNFGENKSLRQKIGSYFRNFMERVNVKRFSKYIDHAFYCSPVVQKLHEGIGLKTAASILPELIKVNDFSEKKLSGRNRLLYVGRISYDKGVDIIVEAFKILKDRYDLTIVGEGNLKLNQCEGMEIFGWQSQDELKKFYKDSDVFVHPCRWAEPFGRTIVEAMAMGMPIITTEGSGSDWVSGNAGLKSKNGSVDSLVEKIRTIFEVPGKFEILSKSAVKRAKELTSNKYAEELLDHCNKLIIGK